MSNKTFPKVRAPWRVGSSRDEDTNTTDMDINRSHKNPRELEGKPEGTHSPTRREGAGNPVPPSKTKNNGSGAANAVPHTSTQQLQEEGAVITVPPSPHQHRGGAVSTVPSQPKKAARGKRTAGKPTRLNPSVVFGKTGSVQAKRRTLPTNTRGAAAALVTATVSTVVGQTTRSVPNTNDNSQVIAGWILHEKTPRGRRAQSDSRSASGPEESFKWRTHKNKKQRRKSRERRAREQETTPVPARQQGAPKTAERGAASDPGHSAALPAPPKGKGAKNKAEKGNDPRARAAAKRARLDESSSPSGEAKKLRLEPAGSSPRVAYADALKADLLVAVTTVTSGHLSPQLSQEVQNQLQARLMEDAMQPGTSQSGPLFRGKPTVVDGGLRLWCENQETLTWLRQCVATITLSTGEKVIVKRQSEISRRVRCGILLPGIWDNFQAVARTLRYQNPWAGIDQWLLHKTDKQETETFAVVSIPEAVVQPLMDRGRRLGFLLGSVYVKFQGAKGKFGEIPPQKTTVSQLTEPEPMDAAEGTETPSDTVTEVSGSQPPVQNNPATERDEEELLRDPSESGEECAQGLGELHIGEGTEDEVGEDDPNGGTPFSQL